MKFRHGFVSNSSSSSFIVFEKDFVRAHIPEDAYIINPDSNQYEIILPNRKYTYEFGWEHRVYYTVMDKLNFAVIQANYLEGNPKRYEECINMIESAIRKDFEETHPGEFGRGLEIVYDFEPQGFDIGPYIDHQSSATEGENIEMFDSDDDMDNFLFNTETYIQGDNDNDEYY